MMDMIQLIAAFLSSVGFAMLFNVRRDRLILAGVGGFLGWAVYLLMGSVLVSDVPRYFVAAVVITVYAEVMARIVKCPATIFVATAAIPLVPGGMLYRSMYAFMSSNSVLGMEYGVEAILLAGALALGMLSPTTLFLLVRRRVERKESAK